MRKRRMTRRKRKFLLIWKRLRLYLKRPDKIKKFIQNICRF